jgi:hypothetical protein
LISRGEAAAWRADVTGESAAVAAADHKEFDHLDDALMRVERRVETLQRRSEGPTEAE